MGLDYPSLEQCFSADVMAGASIGLHQTCGFNLAVASAPEIITPLEWLPCLFHENRLPDFRAETEREETIGLLIRLADHWTAQIAGRAPKRPCLNYPTAAGLSAAKGRRKQFVIFARGI